MIDDDTQLSDHPDFTEALIFRSDYSANPMVAGDCELAVRLNDGGFTVWSWDDDWGIQELFSLPAPSSWRALVEAMLGRDDIATAASLARMTTIGDCPPFGQMIALLWTDDGEHRAVVELLLQLPDIAVEQLATRRGGLRAPSLRRVAQELNDEADELGLDLADISIMLPLPVKSASALQKAVRQAMAIAAERERVEQAQYAQALTPFDDAIAYLITRWAADKPRRRYPGSKPLPPSGQLQLQHYLQQYVLAHGCLPTGAHTIPAGADLFNHESPSFDVDFDGLGSD